MEGRLDLDLEDRMFPTSTAVGLVGGHARESPTFRAQTRPKKQRVSAAGTPRLALPPDRRAALSLALAGLLVLLGCALFLYLSHALVTKL